MLAAAQFGKFVVLAGQSIGGRDATNTATGRRIWR
jgi:hypothetical protein